MPQGTVTILDASRISYTTELVTEVCCNCQMPFAMPRSLRDEALRDHGICFYCPAGHGQCFTGKTEAEKLREKLGAATRRADSAEAAARISRSRRIDAERSAAAYKGVATRQRNRIARGACPCCNRYFPQMHKHMTDKHPQYAGEPLVP